VRASVLALLLIVLSPFVICHSALAQGTAFTYQGRLNDGSSPATGIFDLKFAICDSPTGPNVLRTVSAPAVPVTNGLFTVLLDFGSGVFTGAPRWLELGVRTNGSVADYATLSPRQPVTPTPYAIHAANAKLLDGRGTNAFAPATGSASYVAKSGDTMTGTLNLPANGLVAGGSQLVLSGGDVGIGTANPTSTLHVKDANAFVQVEGTSGISGLRLLNALAQGTAATIFAGDSGAGGQNNLIIADDNNTPRMMVNVASGNIGIGTEPSGARFHVVGNQVYVQGTSMYAALDVNQGGPGPAALLRGGNVGIGTITPNEKLSVAGNLEFQSPDQSPENQFFRVAQLKTRVGAGGTTDLGIWTRLGGDEYERLTITASGNVGIGTTAPVEKLHVAAPQSQIGIEDTSTGQERRWEVNADGNQFRIADETAQAERVVIDSNGNVGIGTISPSVKLTVVGDQTYIQGVGTSGYAALDVSQTGTGAAALFRGGNVGIGTTGPSERLNVIGNVRIEHEGLGIDLSRAGYDEWFIGQIGNGLSVRNHTDSRTDLLIDGSGNVGVGTTAPQAKLHVNGDLRTSVLTITGGADVAEPFAMSEPDLPKGAVVIIDEAQPGRLKLSDQAYDTRVAGIISGAGGVNSGLTLSQQGVLEGGQNVALSGRVYALADATESPIKPGDLLTTSATPGHCMKATDRNRRDGATLGKAMSSLPEGKGLVLVLVTLQ
jgi:hypothetical protein